MAKAKSPATNDKKLPAENILYIPDWQPKIKSTPKTWVTTFVRSIYRSLTDLNYYVDILNAPFKFTLRVLTVFYLIIGLILTIKYTIFSLPQVQNQVTDITNHLASELPGDLTVAWSGSNLTTQPAQFSLTFPANYTPPTFLLKSAVMVDTTTTAEPDNISTLVYLNQQNVFVNNMSGSWTRSGLAELINREAHTMNRNQVINWMQVMAENIKNLLQLSPILIFLASSVGLMLARLLFMFFDALIFEIFFHLVGKPIRYIKAYQICMHLLIPSEIIGQITSWLYPDLPFPMMGLTFWVLALLVLWHLRNLQMVRFELKEKK